QRLPQHDGTKSVGPMEAIASGPISEMADSSSAALLSELNAKRSRLRLWPFVAALAVVIIVALIATNVTVWIVGPLAVLLLVPLFLAYQFDELSKSVVIL